jgi:uncharacterized membrane protein YfcA
MDSALRLPIKASSATSNFMIGVTAAASAGIYYIRGDVFPRVADPSRGSIRSQSSSGSRGLAIGVLLRIRHLSYVG